VTVQYAQIADLVTYGVPVQALQQGANPITNGTLNSELETASEFIDSFLRGRYSLPLQSWGTDITQACCRITAYNVLIVRGYNPASGADVNIRMRYDDAVSWLNKVQRQQAHPNVVPAVNQLTNWQQPFVISSSVIGLSTGATGPNRGW
jgi:phage gp36-like protein